MSLRILQPGRACFGAQEKMCISSNQIEPAGRGAEGAKRGLSGCISPGEAAVGTSAGLPGRCQAVPTSLPPSPCPQTRLVSPHSGTGPRYAALVSHFRETQTRCLSLPSHPALAASLRSASRLAVACLSLESL